MPLNKYVITKQLTKRPEDYPDAKAQPHVQVALRRREAGKRDGVLPVGAKNVLDKPVDLQFFKSVQFVSMWKRAKECLPWRWVPCQSVLALVKKRFHLLQELVLL